MESMHDSATVPVQLVIFDCDGVLVDSEPTTHRVLTQMLGEHGLALPPAILHEHFFGRTASDCVRLARELLGVELPTDFAEQYGERSRAALAAEVTLMPGVNEMLDSLSHPSAIASNGVAAKMRITLGQTGLLSRFEGRWFSVEAVERGKPAPDIYLHAARTLGAAPGRCVVVEDSPAGVVAGVAAGMTVFGYAARTPAPQLLDAGATLSFTQLRQLPDLLALVTTPPGTA